MQTLSDAPEHGADLSEPATYDRVVDALAAVLDRLENAVTVLEQRVRGAE